MPLNLKELQQTKTCNHVSPKTFLKFMKNGKSIIGFVKNPSLYCNQQAHDCSAVQREEI